MNKKCECGGNRVKMSSETGEGIGYEYYKCEKCGDEILDMKQLHMVAEKYREMKLYHAKITKWGQSLGVRIPKELTVKYHFKDNEEVMIVPEKKGIRIIPK